MGNGEVADPGKDEVGQAEEVGPHEAVSLHGEGPEPELPRDEHQVARAMEHDTEEVHPDPAARAQGAGGERGGCKDKKYSVCVFELPSVASLWSFKRWEAFLHLSYYLQRSANVG